MQIKDGFLVQAPLETVWDFLLNIEEMAQCVPGVDSVEAIGDDSYVGIIKVKVGPIAAAFNGTVTLKETEAPHRIVADITGDDPTSATAVKAAFESILEAVDGGTQVNYEMDVNLRGRLAQFGSAIVRATAKKMTAQFADNLRAQLES